MKKHCAKYKALYITFLLCVIIGIVLGIVTVCKNSEIIEILDLKDNILLQFLKEEISCWSVFVSRIIDITFWFLLIILLNAFTFLSWINYVIILYKGYLLGLNIAILCLTTGFLSKLLVLLILFPIWLIILACFCLLCIICIIRSKHAKRYGDGYFVSCKSKFPIKAILLIYFVCILASLIECVVLNIINVTFIIVI